MKYTKENNFYLIKFEHGEIIPQALYNFLKKEKISSGLILSGVGMGEKLKIAYYLGKGKYQDIPAKKIYEIISCQGNIAQKEGKIFAHIHIAIADKDGKIIGGHLQELKVHFTLEMVIVKLNKALLKRNFDRFSGLFLVDL